MNAAAFTALSGSHEVGYVGPINPPAFALEKMASKLKRLAGSRGDFFFFSARRLNSIAREVASRCNTEGALDFFHGFTPWILTRPVGPYIAWSDCTFRDYVDIYHRRTEFTSEDLTRIEQSEADWLKGARRVLFTSEWAAKRAVCDYGLAAERVACVGIFGEIDMPAQDAYVEGSEFVFVSTDFNAKGGHIVLAALREVRKRHPDASLVVVGDRPAGAIDEAGAKFTGFLHKEIPDERRLFGEILGRARAVVHPTRRDIAPLLLVEAAYFGCPAISSRKFAIPEVVEDGHTGILLEDSSQAGAVADAMCRMLDHEDEYRSMRVATWSRSRERNSRERFEDRLLAAVFE